MHHIKKLTLTLTLLATPLYSMPPLGQIYYIETDDEEFVVLSQLDQDSSLSPSSIKKNIPSTAIPHCTPPTPAPTTSPKKLMSWAQIAMAHHDTTPPITIQITDSSSSSSANIAEFSANSTVPQFNLISPSPVRRYPYTGSNYPLDPEIQLAQNDATLVQRCETEKQETLSADTADQNNGKDKSTNKCCRCCIVQ